MRVSLPHSLGEEEVRRRLKEHGHEIADQFPPGMANVSTEWPNDDQMDINITAMGQRVRGVIYIEFDMVQIEVDLPPLLNSLRPVIESGLRKHGGRLLEKE